VVEQLDVASFGDGVKDFQRIVETSLASSVVRQSAPAIGLVDVGACDVYSLVEQPVQRCWVVCELTSNRWSAWETHRFSLCYVLDDQMARGPDVIPELN
jgi:hypothetical protein